MIPDDFKKYFPKIYVDANEPAMLALATSINSLVASVKSDAMALDRLLDPVKCPAWMLDTLSHMFSANTHNFNTEDQKRKLIAQAINTHKLRCTWVDSVKLIIDAMVGADAKIFDSAGSDDWVMVGKGTEPAAYLWAGLGGKDDSLGYGIYLYGKGDEPAVKGNVRIDVDSSTLTATEVDNLKIALADSVPVYMRVILGYVSAGIFTAYPNGVIG